MNVYTKRNSKDINALVQALHPIHGYGKFIIGVDVDRWGSPSWDPYSNNIGRDRRGNQYLTKQVGNTHIRWSCIGRYDNFYRVWSYRRKFVLVEKAVKDPKFSSVRPVLLTHVFCKESGWMWEPCENLSDSLCRSMSAQSWNLPAFSYVGVDAGMVSMPYFPTYEFTFTPKVIKALVIGFQTNLFKESDAD